MIDGRARPYRKVWYPLLLGVYLYGAQPQDRALWKLADLTMLRADAANDVVTAYLLQSEAARSFVFSGDSRYLTEYRQGMVLAPSAEARLDQLPKTPEGTALFTQIQSAAATYSQAAQDIPTWRKWCAVRSTRR